jgi:hypothetical protein
LSAYTFVLSLVLALLAAACGDSQGSPQVDSALLGVYEIDSYRGSQDGCEQASEIEPGPTHIVLYSFIPDDDPDPILAGVFCSSVDNCRQGASEAPAPAIGYSFTAGNDDNGWRGWAIQSGGGANDQCRADVQVHSLIAPSGDTINIETETFVTVFPPELDGTTATCSNRAALEALDDDLPCAEILILDATFVSGI